MKLNEIYSFINENALLTEGVSKKNILAGLDLMASTNLPKIYECEEMFCRHTYDIDYRITNSDKVKKEFYNPDAIGYYKEFTEDWLNFLNFIIKLKQGGVVKLRGEEIDHTFSLDKQKLLEAIQAKRQEEAEFYDPGELDRLNQEDIDKLSRLP